MKQLKYSFAGKVKDLLSDIQWTIDIQEQEELEEGFRESTICDLYGYCGGEECSNFSNCGGA